MTMNALALRISAVGIATVLFAGTAACSSGDDGPSARGCAVPTATPAGVPGRAEAAPQGGGLKVVETGFSQVIKMTKISIGAIVMNTGKQVAYRSRISFDYVDAKGHSLRPDASRSAFLEIPVILPGQRVPVGTWAYVATDANGTPHRVAGLRAELGSTRWAPPSDAFAEISAKTGTVSRDYNVLETGNIGYTVDSRYCRPLVPRGVAAIFRDASGKLIGGSIYLNEALQKCVPGVWRGKLVAETLPTTLDEGRTEVFPYCDLVRATDSTRPDAPYNTNIDPMQNG